MAKSKKAKNGLINRCTPWVGRRCWHTKPSRVILPTLFCNLLAFLFFIRNYANIITHFLLQKALFATI